MKWPLNKEFAFTIIDDTDDSTLEIIRPIYEYLDEKNIKTTKTVWVFPPRDSYQGQTLQDDEYLNFLYKIKSKGFDIQLHNVGSGEFKKNEILQGFNIFREKFGYFPRMQINHDSNPDNIYWGSKRFGPLLKFFFKILYGRSRRYFGDEIGSDYFWGDISIKHIKYTRNRVFNGINTLRYDPKMPYKEKSKKFSNYWFSSSDGFGIEEFEKLLSKRNIDRLRRSNGLCIVYTHFALGFIENDGELNSSFKDSIAYLSSQNGWFVPAGEILDYLLEYHGEKKIGSFYINILDIKWVFDRIVKRLFFGR